MYLIKAIINTKLIKITKNISKTDLFREAYIQWTLYVAALEPWYLGGNYFSSSLTKSQNFNSPIVFNYTCLNV